MEASRRPGDRWTLTFKHSHLGEHRLTPFELTYVCLEPALPRIHATARRELRRIVQQLPESNPNILDVGGRKSHYTIGVPGSVTVTDLPRRSAVQVELNLGVTDAMWEQTARRRSNIAALVLDDMTKSSLPDSTFSCVIAVEVLEHVEEDERFVAEVSRVLKPGGYFVMTTPNGDYIKHEGKNPDHKRHYTRAQLQALLARHLVEVDVHYAVAGGLFHRVGLRSWSMRHPIRTLAGMTSNVINAVQSAPESIRERAIGTHHLVAIARRRLTPATADVRAQNQ